MNSIVQGLETVNKKLVLRGSISYSKYSYCWDVSVVEHRPHVHVDLTLQWSHVVESLGITWARVDGSGLT